MKKLIIKFKERLIKLIVNGERYISNSIIDP